MANKKSNSWILLVSAFIVACLVWYMVVADTNPDISLHLGSQIVNMVNKEEGQIRYAYYIEDHPTVSITVEAPQMKAAVLSVNDFRVSVDVSDCKEGSNLLMPEVTILKNKSVIGNKYSLNHDLVKVRAERLITKEVSVEIKTVGTLQKNLYYGDPVLKHETIQIRVPSSLADKTYRVYGVVDVSDEDATFTNQVALSLLDENNEVVDCDALQIYLNQKTMETTVPIGSLSSAKVILPDVSEYLNESHVCSSIRGSLETVDLIGPKKVVSKIKHIMISASDLDMDSRTESYSRNISIQDYLPENVYVKNHSHDTLQVDLTIEKLDTKEISIPFRQVTITGLVGEERYTIASSTVKVTVTGREQDLKSLTAKDLNLSASVKGMDNGEHELVPTVSFVNEENNRFCKVTNCSTILVKLSGS